MTLAGKFLAAKDVLKVIKYANIKFQLEPKKKSLRIGIFICFIQ